MERAEFRPGPVRLSSTISVICLVTLACSGEEAPLDLGPVAPLPCTLSADLERIVFALDETKALVLTAEKGDCEIERVRLDRQVFQATRASSNWSEGICRNPRGVSVTLPAVVVV